MEIEQLRRALRATKPPDKIEQEPFEHEPKVFTRLCSATADDVRGDDLADYVDDIRYAPLDANLLLFLLPLCLHAWKQHLLGRDNRQFANMSESLFPALARSRVLTDTLDDAQRLAVRQFLADAILELMGTQTRLKPQPSTYDWFAAVSAFAMLFRIDDLWTRWWSMKERGHAICVVQYVSCLIYEECSNPIFAPWTKTHGGGPPALNEPGCHFYQEGWMQENIEFVCNQLTVQAVREALTTAADRMRHDHKRDYDTICEMLAHLESDGGTLLELRVEQLPQFLSDLQDYEWPVL